MPVANAAPGRILLLCFSGLIALWLLGFFQANIMDSIPSTFTIEIGGKPVANVEKDAEDGSQAKLGAVPAIFSLKNSRLQSGDWIMGRNQVENRSYLPKRVSWYKANAENEKLVQLVTAKKEGESYQLIFKNAKLMVDDEGMVLADLLGESQSEVKVILQDG
ncbi:hypothetical protein GT037_008345 [Alternaria burnsii]|uniref:Uncharacterized protein n=1 Tax=Alternaria burnsii TaxID=1187904 RepID=A0A8H7B2G6_9PLEO|nr:uncharacterized protein GT037_008345 [Alternaria burnsii]KAF7673730.1 hypothetical protein GT037_008345 [Alternaria burnsii]